MKNLSQKVVGFLWLIGGFITVQTTALAQITPDSTLGNEPSIVSPNINIRGQLSDLIQGGALRNNTLFHSFSDFNVGELQRVYFANPAGVDNILSRITGNNLSQILGTLGVDGKANLFLLNPNGIVFGENAQLNISGSFIATTADSIRLGDNLTFSATHPETPPLLNINIRPGIQNSNNSLAEITSLGNLAVGQDLILSGSYLNIQASLEAGRDVLLESPNPISISALVSSGGSFLAEQNLFSASSVAILAQENVRFGNYTGISLQILAGGSVSLGDISLETPITPVSPSFPLPILLSQGTSLTFPTYPQIDIRAGIDGSLLENLTPRNPLANPASAGIEVGNMSTVGGSVFLSNQYQPNLNLAGRTIQGGNINASQLIANGGSVVIDAGGDLSLKAIDTSSSDFGENALASAGGNITLLSQGNLLTGDLEASSRAAATSNGNVAASADRGGNITLTAGGNLITGDINTVSEAIAQTTIETAVDSVTASAVSGNGGAIALSATGNIITRTVNTSSQAFLNAITPALEFFPHQVIAGDGGKISFQSFQGNITLTDSFILTFSRAESDLNTEFMSILGRNGGDVHFRSAQAISLMSSLINTTASGNYSQERGEGRAGNITLQANAANTQETAIQLIDTSIDAASFRTDGKSGNITLEALNNGKIELLGQSFSPQIYSDTFASDAEALGQTTGGNIILRGGDITLHRYNLDATVHPGSRGNGGSILLEGNTITIERESSIETDTLGIGNAGNIYLSAPNGIVTLTENASINASTNSNGNAGNISISGSSIFVQEKATIRAGVSPTSLLADTVLYLFDTQGNLLAQNDDSDPSWGAGGSVSWLDSYLQYIFEEDGKYLIGVGAYGSFVEAGEIRGQALASGEDYTLQVSIENHPLSLFSNANRMIMKAQGNHTPATAQPLNDFFFLNPTHSNPNVEASTTFPYVSIDAKGDGTFDYYSFNAIAGSLGIFDIDTAINQGGEAGNINLNAGNGIFLNNSLISNQVEGGNPNSDRANIRLTAHTINLENNAQINASTAGTGQGGNIFLEARHQGSISLVESILATTVKQGATGEGGNIEILAGSLDANNSQIRTVVESRGFGNGGSINVSANSVNLTAGSRLEASTRGTGNAGNIAVDATERVEVSGVSPFGLFSGLITSTETENSGLGGSITVGLPGQTLNLLRITDGAFLSARTLSENPGGNITVNVNRLELFNGGQLITSGFNHGAAGNISVNAQESVLISGQNPYFRETDARAGIVQKAGANDSRQQAQLIDSTLFSLEPELDIPGGIPHLSILGTGDGTFDYYSFVIPVAGVEGVVSFSLEPVSEFLGMDVFLLNSEGDLLASGINDFNGQLRYTFDSPGMYYLAVGSLDSFPENGNLVGTPLPFGSSYTLRAFLDQPINSNQEANSGLFAQALGSGNAGNLHVNTPILRLAEQGRISAGTTSGIGGDIRLEGLQLQVNNAEISASTETGRAGNIYVSADESIQLHGNESGLFARATQGGEAGNLILSTGTLRIGNGAQATVSSPQGQAGNLSVTAQSLFLNRGSLTAETAGGEEGANIHLKISQLLQLDNESLIAANALGTATGGNLNIASQFLVAFPSNGERGSDIIANAIEGRGGRVDVTAEGMFGIQFRSRQTPLNDITASSEFGESGIVAITRPDVDPSQGLVTLPSTVVDPSTFIAQGCAADSRATAQSTFVITGRGGLPASPNELFGSEGIFADWVTLEGESRHFEESQVRQMSQFVTPQPLIEAQGWKLNPQGFVVLISQPPQTASSSSSAYLVSCQ